MHIRVSTRNMNIYYSLSLSIFPLINLRLPTSIAHSLLNPRIFSLSSSQIINGILGYILSLKLFVFSLFIASLFWLSVLLDDCSLIFCFASWCHMLYLLIIHFSVSMFVLLLIFMWFWSDTSSVYDDWVWMSKPVFVFEFVTACQFESKFKLCCIFFWLFTVLW